MARARHKARIPDTKPRVNTILVDSLDPEEYGIIKYAESVRVDPFIPNQNLWLGRDWASLRAYQMFCNQNPIKCCPVDGAKNNCGYNKSPTCGIVWDAKEVSIRKSAQSRWSEFIITFACYLADVYGWTVGYYFPTKETLIKWSKERIIDKCVNQTPRFEKICHPTNEVITFNKTSFYMFGLHTTPASFSLNVVVVDELAEVKDLVNYRSTKARQQDKKASEKFNINISTPKLPGRDISHEYELGSKHRWHVPCPGCGKYEKLEFLENINYETEKLECRHCNTELDRLSDGIWIPENPESSKISIQYEATYTEPCSVKEMRDLKI
jgi:hypothetical protein